MKSSTFFHDVKSFFRRLVPGRSGAAVLAAAALALPAFLPVPPAAAPEDAIPVSLRADVLGADGPGGRVPLIVLSLGILEGHHVRAHDDAGGRPLDVAVAMPPGVGAEIGYPPGTDPGDASDPGSRVLEGTVHAFVKVWGVGDASVPSTLDLAVSGLACSETRCVPFRFPVTVDVPAADRVRPVEAVPELAAELASAVRVPLGRGVVPVEVGVRPTPGSGWSFEPRFAMEGVEPDSLLKAVILGLVAGLVLNVMPCVLPVLALKVAALVDMARSDRRAFVVRNVAYSAGVMTWFCGFAVLFASAGTLWGGLFRSPWAILVLALLIVALALSLFGVVRLPMPGFRVGPDRGGARDAFVSGFLVTVLATPCSGPLLGGVLGWAAVRSPAEQAAVFASVGLGMAAPFVCMAFLPSLAGRMPRPGRWCGTVARTAGCLLLLTAAWLLSLLPWPGSEARPFDARAFRDALGRENMLVQFTADWCPTCKVLERTVLDRGSLAPYRAKYGLKVVRVDLSRGTPEGEGLLRSMGSVSIPLTVLFPKGDGAARPVVLRDVYTGRTLDGAMRTAFGF